MRSARFIAGLATTALMAALLLVVAGGSTPASAAFAPISACTTGGPRPCVVSVTLNGVTVPHDSGDPSWNGTTETVPTPEGHTGKQVYVNISSDLLAESDNVVIKVDVGSWMVARNYDFIGHDGKFQKSGSIVTLSGHPARELHDDGYTHTSFNVTVQDAGTWGTADSFVVLNGFSRSTNMAGGDYNPIAECESGTCFLPLTLTHRAQYPDMSRFYGRITYRYPYAYLRQWWQVPNPETMTAGSLVVSGSGIGSYSITHDPAGGAMIIDIRDITFPLPSARELAGREVSRQAVVSTRKLVIRRGVIIPTRPAGLSGRRITARAAVVRARVSSHPRGARVRGYQARCTSLNHRHVVTVSDSDRRIRVGGLRPGVAYTCKMRARSKAGPSPWSRRVAHVARRP